jgi:CRISPR system Cascade subunit CasE
MYLSRIELDTNKRQTIRALGSPQMLHAAVENCYSDFSKVNAPRKLWRVDRLGGRFYLLILSPEKPDFTSFSTQFCFSEMQGESKPYNALLSRISAGQRWQFRLRANPVHSAKDGANTSGRGKVYAHVTVEQQKSWLRQRAQSRGFLLTAGDFGDDAESFDITQSEQLRFRRQDNFVTLGVATFEGILKVTDAALFAKTLTEGVGRAKAYGCGLLTIARLT